MTDIVLTVEAPIVSQRGIILGRNQKDADRRPDIGYLHHIKGKRVVWLLEQDNLLTGGANGRSIILAEIDRQIAICAVAKRVCEQRPEIPDDPIEMQEWARLRKAKPQPLQWTTEVREASRDYLQRRTSMTSEQIEATLEKAKAIVEAARAKSDEREGDERVIDEAIGEAQ